MIKVILTTIEKYMSDYLQQLEKRKTQMIQYLLLKVEEQDWHAVQDAGSDLRDIESEMTGYKTAKDEVLAPF